MKRFFCIALTMMLMVSNFGDITAVKAASLNESSGGMLEATDEEKEYWNNVEKELPADIAGSSEGCAVSEQSSGTEWYYVSYFSYREQINDYTCGPACVKMCLMSLGCSRTMNEIIKGCKTTEDSGTTIANMVAYINSVQTKNKYVARFDRPLYSMEMDIKLAIHICDAPAIVGLQERPQYGWPYNLDGHAVCVYGCLDDGSKFAIADPWAGYKSEFQYSEYTRTSAEVHKAYSAVSIGYMY